MMSGIRELFLISWKQLNDKKMRSNKRIERVFR